MQQHPSLRAGVWQPAHPPFYMGFDPTIFEGLAADYLGLVASALHRPVDVALYDNRQQAIAALHRGEIDMLAYDDQPEGTEPGLIYSTPFLLDRPVLVFNRGKGLDPQEDWQGRSMLYMGQQAIKNRLSEHYPGARLEQGFDYVSAIASVAYDNHDMMWLNASTADFLIRQGYSSYLETAPGRSGENLNLRFATVPKNAPLFMAIDQVLQNLPPQSAVRIAETWGLDYSHVVKNHPLLLSKDEQDWLRTHREVKVFFARPYAPLTFLDERGRPRGFSVTLLDMVAQRTGLTFRYENVKTAAELNKKLAENPNALLPVANPADLNNKNFLYSKPYFLIPWVMVAPKNTPAVRDIQQLNGKKIAMYQKFDFMPALKQRFPQIDFVPTDFSLKTVAQLTVGDIDGVLLPQTAANYLIKNYFSDQFRIVYTFPAPTIRVAMATMQGNPHLIDIINKTIADIPPQTFLSQMDSWQNTLIPSRLSLWGDYREIILSLTGVAIVICGFFLWRNTLLRRVLRERQLYEAQLQKEKERANIANESKSVFLAQMSHEIRTPLNALMGLLELEQYDKNSPEQRQQNLLVAWQASKSLSNLVGDVLDLAKIESGTLQIRHVPLSLSDKIQAVSALFTLPAAEKGLTLDTSVELADPYIYSDPSALKQIFSNLVSNAIKFTMEGRVEMALYQAADKEGDLASYVLEISDTGPGLTQEQQEKIFSPYIQVDEIAHQQKGTGLGLTICRHLADLLGGSLTVESEPGEGACFIFRFQAQTSPQPESAVPPANEQATRPLRILIVDDHPANLLLLSQQLSWVGHKVYSALSGGEALELWQEKRPDVVITDCHMPLMDGFTLTRTLRHAEKKENLTPVPVIGLTAMAEQQILARAKAAGMTDCLFKPVDLSTLLTFITRLPGDTIAHEPVINVAISSVAHDALNTLARNNPAAFRDLVSTVLEQNKLDVAAMEHHFETKNYDEFSLSAHRLAGSARLTAYSELSALCEQLQQAADTRDPRLMAQLLASCKELTEGLDKQLTSELTHH